MRTEKDIIKKINEFEDYEEKLLNRLHGENGQDGLRSEGVIARESRALTIVNIQLQTLKWVLDKARYKYEPFD